jgi:NDP-sugar pyrophosphorylase family protein
VIDTAIILAAGLGTRLAPLSAVRAKAALPVAGEPLIRRQVRWLASAGVVQVVVNLHHLPATVTARLGHGEDLGVRVRYSWEPVVLGSAGGPRRAFDLVDADRAFIVNGDMVTDVDLRALAGAHLRRRPLVTLAAIDARPGYNALLADESGALLGVVAAGSDQARPHSSRATHFIGVQVAERAAFAAAPADRPSESVKWLYPRLLAADRDSVGVWHTGAAYHDIGTPEEYLQTAVRLAAAEGRPLDRGEACAIDTTAAVVDSVLWDRVSIGPGAIVRGCVVADDVAIPAGVEISGAAIVPLIHAVAGTPGRAVGAAWIAPLTPTPAGQVSA